jgi:membrane protein DedA with SNARE-associated domain
MRRSARSIVPLVAGIFSMPYWPFQMANFASAFLLATVVLQLGRVGSNFLIWLWE